MTSTPYPTPARRWKPGSTAKRLFAYTGTYHALHLQDVYTNGRATVKFGLRYDHQTGNNLESSITANMVAPDLLPAVQVPATEPIKPWQTLSPRIGFTYDMSADGRDHLFERAMPVIYDLLNLGPHVSRMNAGLVAEIDYPWTDLNGDGNVQRNEIDDTDLLVLTQRRPGQSRVRHVPEPT